MEIEKKLEKLKTVERELTNKEQELQDVCLCVREREKEVVKSVFQLYSVLFSERDRLKPERNNWRPRPGEE